MLLSPKYSAIRRAFFIIWVAGTLLLPVILWIPAVTDDATSVLRRSGVYGKWMHHIASQPDGISRVNARMEYLNRAVFPVLGRAARRHLWWILLIEISWPVLLIAVYPRAKKLYDSWREKPAGGRWASTREVLSRFTAREGEVVSYIGMLDSGYRRMLTMPYSLLGMGLLIVGGTGAGKTWGVLIPKILHLARQKEVSVIAVDIKFGERDCLSVAARVWAKYGTVVAWNPWDPASIRIDVMAGLDTQGDIRDQVAILMGHSPTQAAEDIQFWSSNEAQVLDVLLNASRLEGKHMDRVRELSYLMPEQLQKMVATLPEPELRRKLDRFFGVSYDKQAGTLQGLEKYLSDWDDPNVVRATTPGSPDETFDLRRILKEHTLFVVAIPQEKFVSGHALLMFRLIIRMITKMLLSSKAPDERQKVVLVLEEFPQLERIPYFGRFLATCRSRGVATVVTAQGMYQGYSEYGRDAFLGLLNNFRTRMIFPSSLSQEEAEYFSRLFGKETVDILSWGASDAGRRLSVSEGTRPLASHEEMHWKWGVFQAVVHTQGIPDFTIYCPPAITVRPFRDWLVEGGGVSGGEDESGKARTEVTPPTMDEILEWYRRKEGERKFTEFVRGLACTAADGESPLPPVREAPDEPAVRPGKPPEEKSAGSLPSPGGPTVRRKATQASTPAARTHGGEYATGAEVIRVIATALLELAASDPQSVAAVEVKAGRGKAVSYILLPRGILEEIFGVSFQRSLVSWMEYGWMAPKAGERFRLERTICQMLPADLAERLIRVFIRGRHGETAAAKKEEVTDDRLAGEAMRQVCLWVSRNLAHFEGHPSHDGTEVYGIYEEGTCVGIIPHVLHGVQGGSREENWKVWARWRDKGWTRVSEKGRLTEQVRMKDGNRQRLVVIYWPVYEAAVSGRELEPHGQLELAMEINLRRR